jgi:hypothetical protein
MLNELAKYPLATVGKYVTIGSAYAINDECFRQPDRDSKSRVY